jgi:hypothetical protein
MKVGTRRKLSDWAYFASSIALATLLLAMVCLIASRFKHTFQFPGVKNDLSARTTSIVNSISGNISCTVILPHRNEFFKSLVELLQKYSDATPPSVNFTLNFYDPHSNLAEAAAAVQRYGVKGWAVIFDNGNRFEIVPYDSLLQKNSDAESAKSPAKPNAKFFQGEQACAAALARLTSPKAPVIYALSGHGERDFSSYDPLTGYSDFARELGREGYVWHELRTTDNGIPADCDLLIVAGPRFAPGQIEESAITEYLGRGGRFLFLVDRFATIPNGWEGIMARLGLKFSNLTAIDADTLGGYNLVSDNFGDHPVANYMDSSAVYFVSPQVLDSALPAAGTPPPQISAVVSAPKTAWGESNPDSFPRHYDKDVDRKEPLSLAMAVEGPGGSNMGLLPFRAFVIGDSNFAANSLLEGGTTANRDLLLNAVSWLTEQGWSTERAPGQESVVLHLAISRTRKRNFWLLSVVAWPLATILLGTIMAVVRRLTT